jgi:V/A-type H+/Na+-transporting ATPase subunit I
MIAEMERLELVCLRGVLDDLLEFIQEEGLLHIEEVPLSASHVKGYLHRVRLTEAQRRSSEALEELQRMLNEVAPLLETKTETDETAAAARTLREETEPQWCRKARSWSRELRSLARRRANLRDNLDVLANFQKTLRVIAPLVQERHVTLGKDARAFILKGETGRAVERLEERAREELGAGARLIHHRLGRDLAVGLLCYPEGLDSTVCDMLHEEHVAPLDLPDKVLAGGNLQDVVGRVDLALTKEHEDLDNIVEEMRRFTEEKGAELTALQKIVTDRLAQLGVVNRLAQSQLVAVIHGWAPAERVPAFEAKLEERFPGNVALARLPLVEVERERIPTLLHNHPAVKPFEVLLSLFQPPTYGTMDPSALVGVFFVLFYGFILGDAAYGLAVMAFAIFLRRRFGTNPVVRAASTVGLYMGVSAIVFGVLYGEYAGDLGERLFGLTPVWIHRGHDTMTLLIAAVSLGAFHMVLSMIVGIREELRRRSAKHAAEKLGMLLGLLGVGLGVMDYAGVPGFGSTAVAAAALGLLVGCAVLLIWSSGFMAPIQMLEVLSLVTNVLSYCRLMALGIASLALADVANELARDVGNLYIGVPLALAVHLVNVCIGMFSPALHSLRLNYVESLPKFYTPAGKAYKPFRKEAVW